MRDIKLTLSQDKRRRSQTVEDEAAWVNRTRDIKYAIPTRPREAQAGCWVYFIRAGLLVARAKADEFIRLPTGEHLESYTGVKEEKGGWHVVISSMEVLPKSKRLPHDPHFFQGYHYVRAHEKTTFERAFGR